MPGATSAFTAAGTILAISAGVPATLTPTAYAALTFTTIGEITGAGTVGRTYNIVNHNPLATRGTVKLKGSFDDGSVTAPAAYAPGDPGQVLVQTALDSDAFYSFKETLQDGTIIYYQGQVTAAPITADGVDSIVSTSIAIAVKSGTIKIKLPA